MDKNQQVLNIMKKLKDNNPAQALKKVSDIDCGMRFVLMYLIDSTEEVYASTISEKMNISRSRIGILLKKMEYKGYITKTSSHKDARIEVINITDIGLKSCNEIKYETMKNIATLIDEIGYDEFNEFLDMACKIKNIMEGVENV